ncbi:MAG: hypothetical protein ACTSSJ_00440 [Candidatus Odinarchaeia archaeon]
MKASDVANKIIAAIFGIIFIYILITQLSTITAFQYAPSNQPLVLVPFSSLLQYVSEWMWTQRLVDTLAQAIVLFAAAAAAAALFRPDKEPVELPTSELVEEKSSTEEEA